MTDEERAELITLCTTAALLSDKGELRTHWVHGHIHVVVSRPFYDGHCGETMIYWYGEGQSEVMVYDSQDSPAWILSHRVGRKMLNIMRRHMILESLALLSDSTERSG